jgi:hypothetical protein
MNRAAAPAPVGVQVIGGPWHQEAKPMAGRGPQTYKKRQKEQQRKERQQEKAAKRLQRKQDKLTGTGPSYDEPDADQLTDLDDDRVTDTETETETEHPEPVQP